MKKNALRDLLDCPPGLAVNATIEDAHARPREGVTASFNSGRSFGIVLGTVSALGFAYNLVSPQKWKREFDLIGADKDASTWLAKKLFPGAAEFMTKKSHHGRAEALLLAEYGRRKNVL
jgi:hypothetical protein